MKIIRFDCPRQIGKTTYAIGILERHPHAIMLVPTRSHLQVVGRMLDAVNSPEGHALFRRVREWDGHTALRAVYTDLIILDEVRVKNSDIHRLLRPPSVSPDAFVVVFETSAKKDALLMQAITGIPMAPMRKKPNMKDFRYPEIECKELRKK